MPNDEQDHQTLSKFGSRLREIRLSLGLSQETLAYMANIDRSYLGAVERGEHNIALLNICKLAAAMSITPEDFFKNG